MNRNTKAQRKFRAKKDKAGLTEIRGLFAPKALHKAIKDKIRELFKLC